MLARRNKTVTQHDEEFKLMEGKYIQVKELMRISIVEFCPKNIGTRKQTFYYLKPLHEVQHSDVHNEV